MMSPILIITYKRLDGLKRLVNSLLLNSECSSSELWVAIDYCDNHTTTKILTYVKSITGFLKINILVRENNLGMNENGWSAINEIFKMYDYCIVLEDDIVVSTIFLKYMNFYLKKYLDRSDVFSISSYSGNSSPGEQLVNYTFFSRDYVSWGAGLYKRAVMNPNLIYSKDKYYYLNFFNWLRTCRVNEKLFPLICQGYINNNIYPDAMFSHYVIRNNLLLIKPKYNLIVNHGFDLDATNCRVEDSIDMKLPGDNFLFSEPTYQDLCCGSVKLGNFFYYILFVIYFLFGPQIATIIHLAFKKIYKFIRSVVL
jgi:hypothetical protein